MEPEFKIGGRARRRSSQSMSWFQNGLASQPILHHLADFESILVALHLLRVVTDDLLSKIIGLSVLV